MPRMNNTVVHNPQSFAIKNKRNTRSAGQYMVFKQGDGTTMKLVDQNGKQGIPLPEIAVAMREGGDNYRLLFYYKQGEAPRGNAKDTLNTSVFNETSLIVQTGVDEASGKPKGWAFKRLVCAGWAHDVFEEDEVRYEKVVCLTAIVTDWDNKPIDLKTIAPPIEISEKR